MDSTVGPKSEPTQIESTFSNVDISAIQRARTYSQNAIEVPFAVITGNEQLALAAMLFINVTERVVYFKIMNTDGSVVTILPSSSGRITANGSELTFISWQRAPGIDQWYTISPSRLLLLTSFLNVFETDDGSLQTRTRLLGIPSNNAFVDNQIVPVMALTIGSVNGVTGTLQARTLPSIILPKEVAEAPSLFTSPREQYRHVESRPTSLTRMNVNIPIPPVSRSFDVESSSDKNIKTSSKLSNSLNSLKNWAVVLPIEIIVLVFLIILIIIVAHFS